MKFKINYNYVLAIFLFMFENCFYMVRSDLNFFGFISFLDIVTILYILFLSPFIFKKKQKNSTNNYSKFVFFICFIPLISSYMQFKYSGQAYMLGLLPQRYFIILMLSYFPLKKMLDENVINIDKIFKLVILLSVISSSIFLFQKFIYSKFVFLNVYTSYRDGVRLYVDSSIIDYGAVISLYYFCKDNKYKYLFSYILCLSCLFLVSQGRLELIAIMIASIVCFLLTGKLTKRKFATLLIMVTCLFLFLNTNYFEKLVNSILNSNVLTIEQGNTMAIRNEGKKMFIDLVNESFDRLLFGCGYPSMKNFNLLNKLGYNKGIYLSDDGIVGYIYVNGLLGFLNVLLIVVSMLKDAILNLKINKYVLVLSLILMLMILSYNIIFWYWNCDGTLLLVLLILYVNNVKNSGLERKVLS